MSFIGCVFIQSCSCLSLGLWGIDLASVCTCSWIVCRVVWNQVISHVVANAMFISHVVANAMIISQVVA